MPNRPPPRTCAAAAILLVAGALFACRSARPGAEHPGYRRVLPPVAFEMMVDAPYMAVLDLRTPAEYHGPAGHLQRAVSLPLDELAKRLPEILYLREQTFLVYCRQGDDCGARAMRFLTDHGFPDAVLMAGGIETWLADGYGTVGHGPAMGLPEDSGLRVTREHGGSGEGHIPEPPE